MIDKRRLKLDKLLRDTLGTTQVYYQPPASVQMEYPCIRYNMAKVPVDYADDRAYLIRAKYIVTYITTEPDDPMKETLVETLRTPVIQIYAADGLYHYVYEVYY